MKKENYLFLKKLIENGNYKIDVNNTSIINSKNKTISGYINNRGYKIYELYMNSKCKAYTLGQLLSFQLGLLNDSNFLEYEATIKHSVKNKSEINSSDIIPGSRIVTRKEHQSTMYSPYQYWESNGYENRKNKKLKIDDLHLGKTIINLRKEKSVKEIAIYLNNIVSYSTIYRWLKNKKEMILNECK